MAMLRSFRFILRFPISKGVVIMTTTIKQITEVYTVRGEEIEATANARFAMELASKYSMSN